MVYSNILYETDYGVAWITLNRPTKRSAFSIKLCSEFQDALPNAGRLPQASSRGRGHAHCKADVSIWPDVSLLIKPRPRIRAGLPVLKSERADNAVEAGISSMALPFPVALKALGVNRKSELGAVRLNLRDAESVSGAVQRSVAPRQRALRRAHGERQRHRTNCWFTYDPMFGAVMTLGVGGVLVELCATVSR